MANANGHQRGASWHQIVVFTLSNESFGVDISQVSEVIRVPAITRVPRTSNVVEGVINLRGGVIPVFDLGRSFGFDPGQPKLDSRDSRIVIVEVCGHTLGMRVDGVSEVLRVASEHIEPPPPYIVNIHSRFISGIARVDDRLVLLLDLNHVLSREETEELAEAVRVATVGAGR